MEHKEHEHGHEHHGHKKEETFQIKKVRVWQGLSAILGLAVIYMFFFSGSGGPSVGQQVLPTLPSAPAQQPSQPLAPAQKLDIDLDDDPVLGDPNAPVTIVSFEDYQCPFCGRAHTQSFPQIKSNYIDTGKVKYVFRDFPLSFHPNAQPAAEASECADEQGKFWEYHDALYANQQTLSPSLYTKLAGDLGLDVDQFTSCFDSGKYREEVQADFQYGGSVGVSGTPTFFINGIKLVGAQPYAAFQQIIEAELAG
jgi:protein-disulfide isomerase